MIFPCSMKSQKDNPDVNAIGGHRPHVLPKLHCHFEPLDFAQGKLQREILLFLSVRGRQKSRERFLLRRNDTREKVSIPEFATLCQVR